MTRSRGVGPIWVLGMVLGGVASLLQLILPVDSPSWVVAGLASGIIAALVMLVAVLRMKGVARGPWWALFAYAALTVTADLTYTAQQQLLDSDPFPGPSDPLYLASYLAAIVALVLLTRHLFPGHDREAWIDAAIITVAVLAAMNVLLLAPVLDGSADLSAENVLALAYPILDVVVVAVLVRLIMGLRRFTLTLSLITASFAASFSGDLIYNSMVVHGFSDAGTAVSEALYVAALVLLAGAATSPHAAELAVPVTAATARRASIRTSALTIGVLAPPLLMLVVEWPDEQSTTRFLTFASIAVILLTLLRIRGLIRVVEVQAAQLARQARTDALTGLPNRRTLDYELERTVSQCEATGSPLTVAMLDLDHFKDFNDEHGHQAGDALLAETARLWSAELPASAFLARYGGEEFALLLPGTSDAEALGLMERLRTVMRECSVSIGCALRADGDDAFTVVHRADQALYEAKANGRDRVVRAP